MIIRRFASNSAPGPTIECTLSVWPVKTGTGTAGINLNYCYRFSRPNFTVNSGGILKVSVEPDTPYLIYSYSATSPGIIITSGQPPLPFPIRPDRKFINFDLQLRANELVLLSIIVIDKTKLPIHPDGAPDLICCDPQVANDARTLSGGPVHLP